jgi:Domain of unknown function (DUF5666)
MDCRGRRVGVWSFAILLLSIPLMAQSGGGQGQPPPPPQMREGMGRRMGGERAGGTIVSVGVDRFELKNMRGENQTVLVNDQTRIVEGQQENQKQLGLEDLKPGDHVMAMGNPDENKNLAASFVRRLTPEEVARMQNAGDRAFGEIVSIQGNELKIRSRFRGDQTVVVNDQTSVLKDGQAIKLSDLKVGDRIFATGKEVDGKLAAERVMTGRMRRGRGRMMPPRSDGQPPQNP